MKITRFAAVVAMAGLVSAAGAETLWFTGTYSNQVWQANADGSGVPSVLYDPASDSGSGPTGIDIDPTTGELYWGTGNNTDFWSGNRDGSGAGFFADPSIDFDEAHGTAVDPIGQRVFLINDTIGLWVVNTDGSGLTNLGFAPGGTNGLEWDAANNRVLVGQQWNGEVWAVAPDGSSSSLLVSGFFGVRDVATNGSHIFWVDLANVWMANADGTNPQVIADAIDGGNIRTIDAMGGTLYLGEFSGFGPDTIWTIDLATGAETVLYTGDFGSIRGVTEIPAPATLALLGCGGLAIRRRR
ncbi:MAG: hypothetical protein ACF8NJ_01085 [Phycisphaerales bacterium JB038]